MARDWYSDALLLKTTVLMSLIFFCSSDSDFVFIPILSIFTPHIIKLQHQLQRSFFFSTEK
tara:strand:+ start:5774 stop:5956 length:183 start_codon:yes stop_codon:yes gene_type:complete